jgi:hypothetical protein
MNDLQFAQFVEAYPAARRQRGYMAEHLFLAACEKVPFTELLAALEQHKRSEQWRNGRIIPSMVTWLQEERWIQVLPEPEIPAGRLTPWQHAQRQGLK